jgi:hypothetical protein
MRGDAVVIVHKIMGVPMILVDNLMTTSMKFIVHNACQLPVVSKWYPPVTVSSPSEPPGCVSIGMTIVSPVNPFRTGATRFRSAYK